MLEVKQYADAKLLKYRKESLLGIIVNLLKGEPILDTDNMKLMVRNMIGDLTFKEIHDNNKWNLNITVTDANKVDEARLLNYLTSPNVIVWSAVCASTAIPMFFESVELMIKTENGEIRPYHPNTSLTRYIDGTIAGDLPMQRMSELFNVNTFIVSQVNPYVVPFVSVDGGGILESKIRRQLTMTFKTLVGNEVTHVIQQLSALGLLPISVKRLSYLIT